MFAVVFYGNIVKFSCMLLHFVPFYIDFALKELFMLCFQYASS